MSDLIRDLHELNRRLAASDSGDEDIPDARFTEPLGEDDIDTLFGEYRMPDSFCAVLEMVGFSPGFSLAGMSLGPERRETYLEHLDEQPDDIDTEETEALELRAVGEVYTRAAVIAVVRAEGDREGEIGIVDFENARQYTPMAPNLEGFLLMAGNRQLDKSPGADPRTRLREIAAALHFDPRFVPGWLEYP